MGIVNGSLKAELANQKANEKCLPHYPYQPFPQSLLHKQGKGGLLLELNAVPPDIVRTELPEEAYWWTDAQFLPYNDGQLLTSATAYLTHALHAWVKVRSMPAGRIILHHLRMTAIESEVLKGTQSSVYPKAQPHPLGQAVGYAGVGELNVVSMRSEPLYTLMRDANNRVHCFCAISSNGVNLAVVTRERGSYFLEIFMFDFRLLQYTRPVECHKLCKGFKRSSTHNDHVECKWSPDSSHVAVSSSTGRLFLVHKTHVQQARVVCPDLLQAHVSTAASYDFDPRHGSSRLAVGTADGKLSLVSVDCDHKPVVLQRDTENAIDCVQYSQDGSCLAASFRNFLVKVYDATQLTEFHELSMSERCSPQAARVSGGPNPAIMRLSFTYDACCLATSSCDGKVRVWAVPRLLSLQEACRKAVLSSIPVWKVRNCRLPHKVRAFLLQEYF